MTAGYTVEKTKSSNWTNPARFVDLASNRQILRDSPTTSEELGGLF